jgi:hypothetical protein
MKKAVAIAAFALALCIWLVVWTVIPPDPPNERGLSIQEKLPFAVALSSGERQNTNTESRRALAAEILVTDRNQSPLSGAAINFVEKVDSGMISAQKPEIATTSLSGVATIREFSPGSRWILSKDGYVPELITLKGPGQYTVALQKSSHLTVKCFCGSLPVRDCTVILSKDEVATGDFAIRLGDVRATGDRSSACPIWVEKTDANGVCAFDISPDGSPLRLSVFHDAFYPIDEDALGLKSIARSTTQVNVPMDEMYAVLCRLPSDQTILSHFWSYDNRGRSIQIGALARMRFCLKRLTERFPGSLAITCRPADTTVDLKASIDILAKDGTEWSLTWAFLPITRIAQPVFPDLVATPARAQVEAKFVVGGAEIKGERMRLVKQSEKGRALVFPVKSGSVIDVPAGLYNLEPQFPMAWGEETPDTLPTKVEANSRTTLVVSTRLHMARCEFEPQLLHDSLDRAVQLSIVGDEASLNMIWRKEDGPVVVWLPPGQYSIAAYADGYGKVERNFISPNDKNTCGEVLLVLEKIAR